MATALALEDARGERVVVVCVDLHSGSAPVWRRAAERAGIEPERLIISGTHTHGGPAQHYGARMYTWFANAKQRGTRRSGERVADAIATAVRIALDDLRPGGVAVQRAAVVGAASNRSFGAWRNNPPDEVEAFTTSGPGAVIPHDAAEADRACDPRATVLCASADDGSRTAALAWFAVHGTALGATWPTFSADVWGEARGAVEQAVGRPIAGIGFGGGASGDVSPLPLEPASTVRQGDAERPSEQGRPLAHAVGRRIGMTVADSVASAECAPFDLSVAYREWKPRDADLPSPLIGLATAGAGVDGPTELWGRVADGVQAELYQKRQWRRRFMTSGHHPKIAIDAAYSPIPLPIRPVIRLIAPRSLPLWALRVGTHVFATVPGEATTMAGWRIERSLLGLDGVESASIVGFAGDYAGYWTTREEYEMQRYEGSSTLFGPDASQALGDALLALTRRTV